MKYIDADKLKAQIEQLYYNEAEKDESILAADAYKNALDAVNKLIDSLQQEQLEVGFNKELDSFYDSPLLEGETISFMSYTRIAKHFYELGQLEMRHKITNPEYNAKVVEQLKSEYPARKEDSYEIH